MKSSDNGLTDIARHVIVWYRSCGIESRSTNQNCPFRNSHRPARRQSDRFAIVELLDPRFRGDQKDRSSGHCLQLKKCRCKDGDLYWSGPRRATSARRAVSATPWSAICGRPNLLLDLLARRRRPGLLLRGQRHATHDIDVVRHHRHQPARYGLPDTARLVMGCHSAQETRIQSALDDVASGYCSPRHRVPL